MIHFPGCWRGAILGLFLLAGCSFTDHQAGPDTTYTDLVTRLAQARQSQSAALVLWDRVIFGEMVSCQEAVFVPEPLALSPGALAAHPTAEAIQAQINLAIQNVRDSSDLWNIECDSERPYVPLSMARAGRKAALAAASPLGEAESLLAAWP